MVVLNEVRSGSAVPLSDNMHIGMIGIGDASDRITYRVSNTSTDSFTGLGVMFEPVEGNGLEDSVRVFENVIHTWPLLQVAGVDNIGGLWVVCNDVATQVRAGVGTSGNPISLGNLGSESYVDFDVYLAVPESKDAVGLLKYKMTVEYEYIR